MKLTFPHMGNLSLLMSALLRDLEIDFVPPPKSSAATVELGARYAPGGACMPSKIILGNFLEAYNNGADTALFFGGKGPCCFGYFAETYRLIFKNNGIKMRVISLDNDLSGVIKSLKLISGGNARVRKLPGLAVVGVQCARELDRLEQQLLFYRASIMNEKEKARFNAFERQAFSCLEKASGLYDLAEKIKWIHSELESGFTTDFSPYIKIEIVGDIYTVIDPFINKNVQRILADKGIISEKSMSVYKWLVEKTLKKAEPWQMYADKYMKRSVGGFARETVGAAGYAAARGADGIAEIYPLGCMPETVAKGILPAVSARYGVPVLTLVLDEMSGDEGYITRLEAFADMIERRRRVDEKVLSRS